MSKIGTLEQKIKELSKENNILWKKIYEKQNTQDQFKATIGEIIEKKGCAIDPAFQKAMRNEFGLLKNEDVVASDESESVPRPEDMQLSAAPSMSLEAVKQITTKQTNMVYRNCSELTHDGGLMNAEREVSAEGSQASDASDVSFIKRQ